MKSDAQLAACAIGAEGINQSAYGLSISAPGAASGGGAVGAAKVPEGKMVRPLGDVSADGKVTVTSGGGGTAEVTPENTVEKGLRLEASAARAIKQEAAARSQQIFAAMAPKNMAQAFRSSAPAPTTRAKSSGREM